MVDCVVILRHEVVDGSAFRNLRVKKYRGSGFSADEFPITLTKEGLQLTNRGPTELQYANHGGEYLLDGWAQHRRGDHNRHFHHRRHLDPRL